MAQEPGELSRLIGVSRKGDRQAEARLFEMLYHDLHRMAAIQLRRERPDHTLQPTALVNELYLRIFETNTPAPQDRGHFLAICARVMRRILVDHARSKGAAKRGASPQRVPLDDLIVYSPGQEREIVAIHEALERLEQFSPRKSRVVELRFFGGLSEEEIADALQISSRTVKRDWEMARSWLDAELSV
jgi:RNA polymerase sigma factor (TIGR02999 family)